VERFAHLAGFFLDEILKVVAHVQAELGTATIVPSRSSHPSGVNDWPVSSLWNQLQGRTVGQAVNVEIVV
jgi:hypothetical protein